MTNKELQELLKQYPDDEEIFCNDGDGDCGVVINVRRETQYILHQKDDGTWSGTEVKVLSII
jgi:hypothetical protein